MNQTRLRLCLLVVAILFTTVLTAADKPNVLFIMSDDLNTALSGYGHPECRTPHLDEFAKTGVSFTRAFCQFPLCGPSRASILTGQYPLVNGVTGNGGTVAPEQITLPRHFANHGYWSARISKIYHMGIPGDIMEGTAGRDHAASWQMTHNVSALEALTPGKAEDFTSPKAVTGYPEERQKWLDAQASGERYRMSRIARAQFASIEVLQENQHLLADAMTTDKAIDVLQSRIGNAEPFFLAVGLVRPHFPFIGTDETMAQYPVSRIGIPSVPPDDHDDMPSQTLSSVQKFGKTPLQKMRRAYYGAIGFMDQQVGRLLAELDRLDLRDNTIVVFVSDHGYLLGEHHMWKKAKLWEEAIRIPLIISAPGRKQAVKCDHTVELIDLYPTLTQLAGIPAQADIQGQSLVELLDDPQASLPKNDALIQVSNGYGLRSGNWAYMWYPKSKKHEQEGIMLYDMETDPNQYANLADSIEHAAIRTKLHRRLLQRIAAASPRKPDSVR